jgi:hypothetical protein
MKAFMFSVPFKFVIYQRNVVFAEQIFLCIIITKILDYAKSSYMEVSNILILKKYKIVLNRTTFKIHLKRYTHIFRILEFYASIILRMWRK